MDDNSIIELYFARCEAAITETANKYGRLCFQIANNILRSQEDADECVNDTYLKVWRAIPPTIPNCFRNYLCRIVRNLSLQKYEYNSAKKRSKEFEVPLTEIESIIPDSSIENGVGNDALGGFINDFLGTLSRDARVIFIRKYWYFDTVGDIAARCSFTENKVKVSLHRTRSKLKEYLSERGISI